jgi:capsular exopolysaccharide synthesis family protein
VKIKLSVVEGIEHYLNADEGKGALPSTLGVNDAGLQGLMDRLNDLLLEKTRMLSQLPETNPLFNPINQQINAARNSLRENVRTTKIALSQTLRHLQSVGSGYQSSIRNIPGQERDLVDIKRMQSIKENLYVYLLQKKEELSLDYASTIADAAIIDLAHSGAQSAPIPKSVYAMAFLLGLIMPTGIIYGREALKSRIQAKQEITAATGLDVLCELSDSETADPIVVNQKSYIGEQFRELRTKLNYLHGNSNPGRTTLFTSSIAGEGKSFVLSNLGAVFAAAGKKTILVELDLRRPTLSTRFSLPNPNLGITDYIIGNVAASEIIQQSEVSKNLHIICGGSIPPNPSELLESKMLTDLINELKNKYDHILIDTPPVHLLTDAMIITHLCDISLYITRYNYTPKQELEYIREIYNGKIFNSVKIDSQNSSYLYQKNAYIKAPSKTFKTRVKKFISRF